MNKTGVNKKLILNYFCLILIIMSATNAFGIDRNTSQILSSKDLAVSTDDLYNEDSSCEKAVTANCTPKYILGGSTCKFDDTQGICICNCVIDFDAPDPKPNILKCNSSCMHVYRNCLRTETFELRSEIKRDKCHTPANLCAQLMQNHKPIPVETQSCVKIPQSTPAAESPQSF